MAQTISSQLGPEAVAHPPVDIPSEKEDQSQTVQTQVGPNAVAPPADYTTEDPNDLVFHDLPPFPEDVPIAPLLRLSLKKLLNNDPEEVERLWQASRDVGFFYLDLSGAIEESKRDSAQDLPNTTSKEGRIDGEGLLKDADAMFKLAPDVFGLPLEDKQQFDYKDKGSYFGYKGYGKGIVDAKGTRDRNEFWNISKDDILGLSERLPNPDVLQDENNRELLSSYILRSQAVIDLLFKHLNDKLGLPPQTLQNLHRLRSRSGDQCRWVWSPPQPEDDRGKVTGEHTDFGSMTVLFNRLGGLQILPPNSEEWCYVRPLKGHCVCNLGDAMVKFTAGILRSNIHRVVNPPGEQSDRTRISLVYFSRPEDDVILKVLDGSNLINESRKGKPEYQQEENVTAKDWILKRAMGKREGGDWKNTLGTEGDRLTKS